MAAIRTTLNCPPKRPPFSTKYFVTAITDELCEGRGSSIGIPTVGGAIFTGSDTDWLQRMGNYAEVYFPGGKNCLECLDAQFFALIEGRPHEWHLLVLNKSKLNILCILPPAQWDYTTIHDQASQSKRISLYLKFVDCADEGTAKATLDDHDVDSLGQGLSTMNLRVKEWVVSNGKQQRHAVPGIISKPSRTGRSFSGTTLADSESGTSTALNQFDNNVETTPELVSMIVNVKYEGKYIRVGVPRPRVVVQVPPGSYEALVQAVCARYSYKNFLLKANGAEIVVAACEVGGIAFESDVTMALAVEHAFDTISVDMMLEDAC